MVFCILSDTVAGFLGKVLLVDIPIDQKLPVSIDLVLGNQLYIAKQNMPPALRNKLIRLAAFQNPEFCLAQAMRLSTFGKPRIIACAEDFPQHIGLPRGCAMPSRCSSPWVSRRR